MGRHKLGSFLTSTIKLTFIFANPLMLIANTSVLAFGHTVLSLLMMVSSCLMCKELPLTGSSGDDAHDSVTCKSQNHDDQGMVCTTELIKGPEHANRTSSTFIIRLNGWCSLDGQTIQAWLQSSQSIH